MNDFKYKKHHILKTFLFTFNFFSKKGCTLYTVQFVKNFKKLYLHIRTVSKDIFGAISSQQSMKRCTYLELLVSTSIGRIFKFQNIWRDSLFNIVFLYFSLVIEGKENLRLRPKKALGC